VFKFLFPAALFVLVVEMMVTGPGISDAETQELPPPAQVDVDAAEGWLLEPRLMAEGLNAPVDVVGDPLSDRLFVAEKAGKVRIVEIGSPIKPKFIDITDWVLSVGNEQGLLSFRFHPDFPDNGRVFLFFTDLAGTSQLVEARVDPDNRDRVIPGSFKRVLSIPQYGQYHQSGSMFFGPDGYLWVSIGDGGGIGDPEEQGQNPRTVEATIIRIDVDKGDPYSVPADNPFVGDPSGRDEVWAYGLRNPWRITADKATGLIYIPDVGQEGSEELNVVPLREGGHNFGWSVSEGTACYDAEDCVMTGQTMPVYQYLHNGNGCAMVGGQVYRGNLMAPLRGHYFLADYCLGWIRSVALDADEVYQVVDWTRSREDRLGNVTTIGSDRHGELYVTNLAGEIWRLEIVPDQ
jgi:glucose/arabinose dehydrogenase